jgi:hypothetical protein
MMEKTFAMISLGCAKNLVNSEQMLYLLSEAGYTLVPEADGADLAVVNTCGFIDAAKSEAIDNILEMAELKRQGMTGKVKLGAYYLVIVLQYVLPFSLILEISIHRNLHLGIPPRQKAHQRRHALEHFLPFIQSVGSHKQLHLLHNILRIDAVGRVCRDGGV